MDVSRKHNRIQSQIVSTCNKLGIDAKLEYRGKGWRADVFVPRSKKPIAFEIQLSPQSLTKTLARQSKYVHDGVIGCWLFETPIPKLINERPDLPVFYVEDKEETLIVNLGDRRKINLQAFLENFLSDKIQFRRMAKTKSLQNVNLVFYEMTCWKCKELNNVYYVETPFYSSCNATIRVEEGLWDSSSVEYKPEIIDLAKKFVENRKELNLKLAQIKERFSQTIGDSYMSFGCHKCDSIFGDFFIKDAKMDIIYEPNKITCQGQIELRKTYNLDIPHWCYPSDGNYCDEH
jgi:phage FluMu protein Com